ncbi:MAG: uroporphyrinogen decarboxylase family protein [Candidatus Bathyarchaeota archaeon]|nr:uroporphyrinogen decarboxylase family protein [Candidatus Bathyarchaeota archaeon]
MIDIKRELANVTETYENIMAAYEGREGAAVVFQPRIKHWYDVNLSARTLPERYQGMYLDEIYRDLDVAPREVWGLGGPASEFAGYLGLQTREGDDVEVWVKRTQGLFYEAEPNDYLITEYRTPVGAIRQVQRLTEHGTSLYNVEYYLKGLKDIEVYKYILQERSYRWDRLRSEWGMSRFGDIIPLRVQLRRSPLMWLMVATMGFQRTVTMLWRHPEEMEGLLQLLGGEFDKQIEACRGKPVAELSFGDNMHQDMCPPPYFKKYVIPFYRRATAKIHAQGMYATSHWDGFVKQLLPLVKETGLDGLECVTPLPQGDITLEEMREGMEGLFLRDGIPAVLFCPWMSLETLAEHVRRLLEMFPPRLILGVSDLLPANADIERIRFVNEIVKEFNESL